MPDPSHDPDTGGSARPTSRWRSAPTEGTKGASDRVVRTQAQTRPTLRLALAFLAGAALAAGSGVARWLPLHLFLAGGVVLAISGVSLMLTVTWSAAPAPGDRWVALQRVLVAGGAAGVAVGRHSQLGVAVVGTAGVAYLAGLLLLAGLLVVTVRRGVERRFDPAVAAYLTAIAFGTTGVLLGARMAVVTPSATMRGAHVTLNVLGMIGLVVGGTLPYFASTVARSRMAAHAGPRRLALSLCLQAATLLLAVVGLWTGHRTIAAAGLGGYALGVLAVLETLPRPTRRHWRWAGPRIVALWAGGLWWAVAVAVSAVDVGTGRVVFGGRWLLVCVVAGYGQVLWGSLAYLLPVLRGGGHERLAEGFASTRSWLGLAAVNAAGLSAAAAMPPPVTWTAIAVWVLDTAWWVARVGTRRADRPLSGPASGPPSPPPERPRS